MSFVAGIVGACLGVLVLGYLLFKWESRADLRERRVNARTARQWRRYKSAADR